MVYVDGFLLAVPEDRVPEYTKIARKAGKIWKEHGALEYRECVLDEPGPAPMRDFSKAAALKPGEVAIFSWITYRSKAHRNAVNKKIMADPRMVAMCNVPMPFDMKRMNYAGFRSIVDQS